MYIIIMVNPCMWVVVFMQFWTCLWVLVFMQFWLEVHVHAVWVY